jgi:hypothetical protein
MRVLTDGKEISIETKHLGLRHEMHVNVYDMM